jgi:hypothetical protein
MNDLDIRDTFVTPLVRLIDANKDDKGFAFLTDDQVSSLIRSACAHRDNFIPYFTDEEVATIIGSIGINWFTSFVKNNSQSYPNSLLSYILANMKMDDFISFMPLTTEVLNNSYSPQAQVNILKSANVMPGYSIHSVEGRQILAGRIAPLICQTSAHLDAWVDEWVRGIKYREMKFRNLSKPLSSVAPVTQAYNRLAPGETELQSLPILMTLVGVLDTESFLHSLRRYSEASLYQISDGEFAGHFFNRHDDFMRRNLVYGLFLLSDKAHEELVVKYIGHDVIDDQHIDLAAALLINSVKWERELLPIDKLMGIKHRFETFDAVDLMLAEHSSHWRNKWFDQLNLCPHGSKLASEVGKIHRFRKWISHYATYSQYGSMAGMRDLSKWIGLMSDHDQDRARVYLLDRFESGIKHKMSKYGSGALYGKALLAAFPEDPYVQALVSDNIGYIVKRALSDNHTELLKEVLARKLVTPRMVGKCIKTHQEFEELTKPMAIDKSLLMPFISIKIRGECLETAIGV